ncbi:transcriptional regulator (plasmid) [Aminobacter sp. SR38]|jgi:putative transcriptional regulator|uniref:helix-turn-helix domain-containing protein n=1 Tax=Aminobacter sp. SR38 TaxID=2774562 RepID=UPI0017842FD9|nr:helix-turn-helix domain-containing protein [Aminobacter sp. SR38]QOF75051.1 transcriptional regulator [Aminobacter sp. SR38]
MSEFAKDLLESAHEAAAIAAGRVGPARAFVPEKVDVVAVRRKTGLSQVRFSDRFGIPVATLRDWEQNRRSPDHTARILLAVIEKEPEAVERAIHTAG